MISPDTIKLLRECDAGIKMGVSSIDEVLGYVHDAAVLSENSIACDENGELLSFSVFDAKRMKVLSMESAMEQLGMDIGW